MDSGVAAQKTKDNGKNIYFWSIKTA